MLINNKKCWFFQVYVEFIKIYRFGLVKTHTSSFVINFIEDGADDSMHFTIYLRKSNPKAELSPSRRREAPCEGTNPPRIFTPGETKALAESKVHQISRAWVTVRVSVGGHPH